MSQYQRNTVAVSLTVDDYVAAHRLHYQRYQRMSYLLVGLILMFGIGLALSGVNAPVGTIIFGGVGGLAGAWWQDRRYLPRKVAKLYAQFKGIAAPFTLSWNEESVDGESANGRSRQPWVDYVAFKENDTMILLYLTDALWQAFPKRWFRDPEQLENFVRCARVAGKL